MAVERMTCMNHSGMEERMKGIESKTEENRSAIIGLNNKIWGVLIQGFFTLLGVVIMYLQSKPPVQ